MVMCERVALDVVGAFWIPSGYSLHCECTPVQYALLATWSTGDDQVLRRLAVSTLGICSQCSSAPAVAVGRFRDEHGHSAASAEAAARSYAMHT